MSDSVLLRDDQPVDPDDELLVKIDLKDNRKNSLGSKTLVVNDDQESILIGDILKGKKADQIMITLYRGYATVITGKDGKDYLVAIYSEGMDYYRYKD